MSAVITAGTHAAPDSAVDRVFNRENVMPPRRMTTVIRSPKAGGNFSHRTLQAIKPFDPMKISRIDNATFRYVNRCTIAASAKYCARRPRIAKMFDA